MSIKITPDKYPQIIEVYNTEGKTAAYDLMRSCYEIKNPTCVMKRMKADKSLGYNYDTDRFESDSRLSESKLAASVRRSACRRFFPVSSACNSMIRKSSYVIDCSEATRISS